MGRGELLVVWFLVVVLGEVLVGEGWSLSGIGGERQEVVSFNGEPVTFSSTSRIGNANLQFFWTLDRDQLNFLFVANSTEPYVGIGLGYNAMSPSDVVVVDRDNGVSEYRLVGRSAQILTQPSGRYEGVSQDATRAGQLKGRFSANLSALSLDPGNINIIWAFGPTSNSDITYHSLRGVIGGFSFSNPTTEVASTSSLKSILIAHGLMMATAWIIIAPFAIISARLLRFRDPLWFHVHKFGNITAVSLFLVAIIIGLIEGSRSHKVHFGIGVAMLITVTIHVTGGFLRPHKDEPYRELWYRVHFTTGSMLWLLGVVNTFLGIKIADAGPWSRVVVGVITGLLVIVMIYGQVARFFKGERGQVVSGNSEEEKHPHV